MWGEDGAFGSVLLLLELSCGLLFLFHVIGKPILALVAHLIDKDFKLHELLFFANPFSDVARSATKI
jgi:hypothetical protein